MPNDPSAHDFDSDDWNSPLDDHLFIVDDGGETERSFMRAIAVAEAEARAPYNPAKARECLRIAQQNADRTVELLGRLVDVLRLDYPGPADRVLKLADDLAVAQGDLSQSLMEFSTASRYSVTLNGCEHTSKVALDLLISVQEAYVCEVKSVRITQLTPSWWTNYPYQRATETARVFFQYREHLGKLFDGSPPLDWEQAVSVRLNSIPPWMVTDAERLRTEMRNERETFGTVGDEGQRPEQADGPADRLGFRLCGKPLDFRRAPLRHRLLSALWDEATGKPRPEVSVDILLSVVYGQHRRTKHVENAIDDIRKQINKLLERNEIPARVQSASGCAFWIELYPA